MQLRKEPEPGSLDSRLGGMGLFLAPVVFIVGWVIGGVGIYGYSPVHEPISRIAAVGSPERSVMTLAFVVYAAWLLAAIPAVRRTCIAPTWMPLLVNALATLGVAALALGRSGLIDGFHAMAAFVAYASLVAIPVLAARPLREGGFSKSAAASWVAAGGITGLLLLSTFVTFRGVAQRAGLVVGDLWLACAGFAIVTGRLPDQRLDDADGVLVTEPEACT